MIKVLLGVFFMASCSAHGAYRYDYRGDALSMFHSTEFATNKYRFGDFVKGYFTVLSPLPANIQLSIDDEESLISDEIVTFNFTDGVSTFTEITSTNFLVRVGTNDKGGLDSWEIFLEREGLDGLPEFVGDANRQIYVRRENNIVGSTLVAVFECTLVVSDFCTRFDSTRASSIGPGSFTGPIEAPTPVPLGGGGALFIMAMLSMTGSRKLIRSRIILAVSQTVWHS